MIPTNDKITIKNKSSLDDWGKPVAGEPVSYFCRLTFKNEKEIDKNGNEIVTQATILLKGYVEVDYGAAIEWTNESGEMVELEPQKINYKKDLAGQVLFTKVVV